MPLPTPSPDAGAAPGPVAIAQHLRTIHLRGLHNGAERGLDAAQAAISARAALCVDDPDVAELATLVRQALAVADRIGARLGGAA